MEFSVPKFVRPSRRTASLKSLLAALVLLVSSADAADFGFVNASNRGTLWNQSQVTDLNALKYLPMLNDFAGIMTPQNTAMYRLWPNSVIWSREATFINYYLQPNLKLGVRYNLNFNFNLTASDDQGKPAGIPDGWYKLTMAAVMPVWNQAYLSPNLSATQRYLASYTSFVRVTNGAFNRIISLDYDNLTGTNVMSILYVELVPLTDQCQVANGRYEPCIRLNTIGEPDTMSSTIQPRPNYKPYVIEVPFIPYLPPDGTRRDPKWETVSTNLLQKNLSEYVARAKLARHRSNTAQPIEPARYAAANGLNFLLPDDNAFEVAGKQYWLQGERAQDVLGRILAQPADGALSLDPKTAEQFLGTICTLLSVDYGDLRTMRNPKAIQKYADIWTTHDLFIKTRWCMRHPDKIFTASRVTHLDRFQSSEIKSVLQRPDKFNVMSSFVVSKGTSDDVSTSKTMGASFGITPGIFKPLDAFGIGINPSVSFGIAHSSSHSDSNSTANSVANSLMETLDFNTVVLNIPAKSARNCIMVRPMNARGDFNFATRWGARNGLYICEPAASAKQVREIYSQIFSRPAATSTIDPYDPGSQAVNLSLRGDREISAFFYTTGSHLEPSVQNGSRIMPFSTLESAAKYFSGTPLLTGNLVITSLRYQAGPEIPSFAVKLAQ